jgi:prepilin-type N-terminal cleavage/methylation domain-containing protein
MHAITNAHRRDEGFTILELMVVVVIIGILVAIAIPVFNSAKANAQTKSCFANQRTLEGAAQAYEVDHGVLPPTGDTAAWAVPDFLASAAACPSDPAKASYLMTVAGTVDNCAFGAPAHNHF